MTQSVTKPFSRRRFLKTAGATVLAAGIGGGHRSRPGAAENPEVRKIYDKWRDAGKF